MINEATAGKNKTKSKENFSCKSMNKMYTLHAEGQPDGQIEI